MVSVPAAKPVTIPVEPTEAMLVLPLLHTPPVVASANVVVLPAHNAEEDGETAEGAGLIVIVFVTYIVPQLKTTE